MTASALDEDARRSDWNAFASRFFSEVALSAPDEVEAFRASPIWPLLVDGARPTHSDIHALKRYDFDPKEFGALPFPVTFFCGSESPPIQSVTTDALMNTIPNAARVELRGQGHTAMYGDPRQFIETVTHVFER